ncbi:MAG: ester cyclase [Pseudomonadota bacterium]
MDGFDPKFKDFPDYIFGVTKEIWEDRRIATLEQYYAPNIIVRSPASVVQGNKGIIAATLATLAEFPDRELLGEDVIWCEAQNGGLLSSHRLVSTATHSHSGVYGPASGKKFRYRILADCHARANQIDDEWLVRDQGAIVRQMGVEPQAYAADLIKKEGGPEVCVRPYTPANDIPGPYQGNGNVEEWGLRYADAVTSIMAADFTVIPKIYDRAVHLSYPGGIETQSHGQADAFWMGLRAAFPSAKFAIHHIIGRDDPLLPPRAAIRWSLAGKHDGWGAFGAPSGAEVFVMGISHAEFGALVSGKPKLRREWALYDETAIWKQILLQTGAV